MTTLLCMAVGLIGGLLMTRVLQKWNMPVVTSYLIAGLLLGPFFIGRLGIPGLGFNTYEQVENYSLVTDLALGFIALSTGNEFRISQLKKIGKQATIVGILQAVITTIVVDIALVVFHFIRPDVLSIPGAISLGAIAAATDPAATLMVVRQYKAKGPITDILLPVVALDDAVGLIVFSFSFGIAEALQSGAMDIVSIIVQPIIQIVLSLGLGFICGLLLTRVVKVIDNNRAKCSAIIAFVFLDVALSKATLTIGKFSVGLSPLLVCMMLGATFCNACKQSYELMDRDDEWAAPLLVIFFVLSGAELNLSMLSHVIIILVGLFYILFRSLGKYIGAFISCKIAKCAPNVVKHFGITLFPQAGVALGMSAIAMANLQGDGELVRSITLFGVLVFELVAPTLTRIALAKAGEIQAANN